MLICPIQNIDIGEIMNTDERYIVVCFCGDDLYYVLTKGWSIQVNRLTMNNILANSSLIFSYDQY
jgi:hypothetical protein